MFIFYYNSVSSFTSNYLFFPLLGLLSDFFVFFSFEFHNGNENPTEVKSGFESCSSYRRNVRLLHQQKKTLEKN